MTTTYGPGDEQTWGPHVGHPNDPRAEDESENEDELLRDYEDHCANAWIDRLDTQ